MSGSVGDGLEESEKQNSEFGIPNAGLSANQIQPQNLGFAGRARNGLGKLDIRSLRQSPVSPEGELNKPTVDENANSSETEAAVAVESWLSGLKSATSKRAGVAADLLRTNIVKSLIGGIRTVSVERDRDEILRWFIDARQVLANPDLKKSEAISQLYKTVDTLRVGKLISNFAGTGLRNYKSSKLPLSLKIALPVAAVGTAIVGAEGAGIAAFGGAIGAPVALLLFLGTAGATSIVEAFVRDRTIRDPLTKLMLTFVAFETSRRAKKELLDAMRADAMTPLRADVPESEQELHEFMLKMDPILFERHVMSFFEKSGHPTGLTARSNDFGVDGYVFHPDGIIVVQCKRYALDNAVGRPAIQQFKGVIEEQKAFRGYFVTTSRFTDEAHESSSKSERIVLVDGTSLAKWHRDGFSI